MVAPTVDALPTAPDRTTGGTQFDADAVAWAAAIALWTTQVNALGLDFNSKYAEILATALAGDLPPLTGHAFKLLRVNAGETAAEFIDFATAAQIRAKTVGVPLSMDAVFAGAASVALVAGATITLDMDAAINADVTLDQNSTLDFSNIQEGQIGRIEVRQPAAGGPYTLAYSANCVHGDATAPVLSAAASALDILRYEGLASGNVLVVLSHTGVA